MPLRRCISLLLSLSSLLARINYGSCLNLFGSFDLQLQAFSMKSFLHFQEGTFREIWSNGKVFVIGIFVEKGDFVSLNVIVDASTEERTILL